MNVAPQNDPASPAYKETAQYIQHLKRKNYKTQQRLHEFGLLLEQNNFEAAYNLIRSITEATAIAELPELVAADVYRCLERISNQMRISNPRLLEEDIIAYRKQAHVDGSGIRTLCLKMIFAKYGKSQNVQLEDLAVDSFFLDCLCNDYFCSPELEKILTGLRRTLLMRSAKSQTLVTDLLSLYQAMAFQGYLTDYAFHLTPEEVKILEGLRQHVHSQVSSIEWSVEAMAPSLLLLAMYGRIYDVPGTESLRMLGRDQLPQYLQSVFAMSYEEAVDIETKKSQIPALGTIEEQTSHVRDQYENYPFPRKSRLPYLAQRVPYQDRSRHLRDPVFDTFVLDKKPLKILVAGCGTGQQPLQLAKSISDCQVTAVDISRTSLAFAERLRIAYDINNIDFFQADILQLAEIFKDKDSKFDLIECGGVLHHMPDLEAGLRNLIDVLIPGGIMHLALYSKIAREPIERIREANENAQLTATVESIREFRHRFMNGQIDESLQRILHSRDFYNIFACKDLLFNSQERCLTIPEIDLLLRSNGLNFMGFSFGRKDTEKLYKKMFPQDTACRNLECWHQFEMAHPHTFWEMYSFHVQKPLSQEIST